MIEKQIYVITGGPGFGKTGLVDALRQSGYPCSDEYARELIEVQQRIGGEVLPWKNPKLFQQEVLRRRINFFETVPDNTIAFADRGIPDQLAFASYKGFGTPPILTDCALTYRYAPLVFITPPWFEIFSNDLIRTETFDEAIGIHEAIRNTYLDLGYELVELPLLPIDQRTKFLLQTIQKLNPTKHEQT